MEVLCRESHSEQINIYVTSVRFSGGTDAMIFNYRTTTWRISSHSIAELTFFRAPGLDFDWCDKQIRTCIHA